MTQVVYAVNQRFENGQEKTIAENLTERQAAELASEQCKEKSGITVSFFRESDGQVGYLNQDGNHEISGRFWG